MNASHTPHLLYVAWGFPPSRGGGVYRALATANRFAARGWRVTVLTADREIFFNYTGADTSLENRIDPRLHVVRVPFSWPVHETNLRKWSRFRMAMPRAWARSRARLDTLHFPEVGYGPWRGTLERAADRIHADDQVDLVVATANPHVAFTPALRLNRRYGVPFVIDYRDAWLLDVFSGGRLHDERSRAAKWERRLVEAATEVWFVNDPIRAWHERLYPGQAAKMHTVANGFDPELAPALHEREPAGKRPLRFGYVGTMSPRVPLAEFVAGWKRACELSDVVASSTASIYGYLGFYALARADLLAIIEDTADAGVTYEGPVAKADIGRVYDTFDVQLLVLGAGRYVTSGKVYEYLATGLPVVSVHDPDNAASSVLRGHPLWFPAGNLEPESVAKALIAAAEAAQTADRETRHRAREFGARFRRDLQLDPRIDALGSELGLAAAAVA
jgi:glycosyltransferase involved in cell wall biosynthesis